MTLEQRIESACGNLPDGWSIRIDIERDAADVTAIRPDATEVQMSDGELDLEEQVGAAICLARDETIYATKYTEGTVLDDGGSSGSW
jgi:hypothetical protein